MFYRINHANTSVPPLREKRGEGKNSCFPSRRKSPFDLITRSPALSDTRRERERGREDRHLYCVHLRQLHLVINWRRLLGKPSRQSGVLLTETQREVYYSRRKLTKRKPCDGLNADQVTTSVDCFVK